MNRLTPFSIALAAACACLPAQNLLTVSPADNLLRTVDPVTGTTLSSLVITEPNNAAIVGANGLALDPITGTIWAVLQVQGNGRQLASINPQTAVASLVGLLSDKFAGIAFDALSQTLYGVTGDGAATPESLFSINTTNAQSTFVMTLGNGTDGETITMPPFDSRLFHASGYLGTRNVDRILETVNIATQAVTPVNYFGHDEDEVLSMTHFAGDTLIAADLNDDLMLFQANGAVTLLGALDHDAKGLVFAVPAPNTPFYAAYGSSCPDTSGYAPVLFGQGSPTPGGTATLVVANAPGSAPAVVLIGTGNGSLSIGACSVQILPLFPASANIVLGGSGAGNGTGALSLPIPLGLPPLDLYFQAAMISGSSILTSTPLRMHIN